MLQNKIKEDMNILEKNNIRTTPVREKVIEYFMKNDDAVSHQDIETHIGKNFDRVTIYRTLNHFESKGVIHKVMDSSGVSKYAMCHSDCGHQHKDNHLHFQCNVCGKLECLYHAHIPEFKLPEKYISQKTYILVEGICVRCNK